VKCRSPHLDQVRAKLLNWPYHGKAFKHNRAKYITWSSPDHFILLSLSQRICLERYQYKLRILFQLKIENLLFHFFQLWTLKSNNQDLVKIIHFTLLHAAWWFYLNLDVTDGFNALFAFFFIIWFMWCNDVYKWLSDGLNNKSLEVAFQPN
jgi:hypothetical protein